MDTSPGDPDDILTVFGPKAVTAITDNSWVASACRHLLSPSDAF